MNENQIVDVTKQKDGTETNRDNGRCGLSKAKPFLEYLEERPVASDSENKPHKREENAAKASRNTVCKGARADPHKRQKLKPQD